ncbi:hypothetical protein OROGR_006972 [Orobanche gracilis]
MIQELLGGNNVGIIKGDEKSKLSNHPSCGGLNILVGSPSSSSSSSSAAAAAAASAASAENLRCPRCDSPNTKFCYYNNYNLTQPRHFCKTCRRYWTKGGALRNVPIGGGCRRNKTSILSSAIGKSTGNLKTLSSEFIKTGLFGGFEHVHDHHHHHQSPSENPNTLWASSQNNYSHFLSLLSRANQNPNYPNSINHLQNFVPVKEEGSHNFLFGSSLSRVTGLDSHCPVRVPSSGLSSSLYRNLQETPASQLGSPHGVHNNNNNYNGFHQDLYQRFRSPSSTSCYFPENTPSILGNMASASNPSTASAILESAPVGTGELGFWNATLPWPTDLHLPTTNGAYH